MQINNPISHKIWEDRYKYGDETEQGTIERVAKFCADTKEEYDNFLDIMEQRLFMPAGRIMTNGGRGKQLTLNNCFVANSVPDSIDGIFDYVKLGAKTHKAGGGIGYDFSEIRPNGTTTSNDAVASGVVSFMRVFDTQTSTILQGGRRGANMAMLNIYHPDIYEYLEAKSSDVNALTHFNLSVMVDDDFMNAVDRDEEIYLHYPVYDKEKNIIKDESKWTHSKKIKAKELWDKIMLGAYNTGEYGVMFYDNINNDNNVSYLETIICSNPCSEYISGEVFGDKSKEYKGACNLGSLFLHNFVTNPFTSIAEFDYKKLDYAIKHAVRLLDNIIDKNFYPDKAYENYQKAFRTIGLGVTGLADMFAMMDMKYSSEDAYYFIDNLMNYIALKAYYESSQLAKEKDSFPLFDKDKFLDSYFIEKHSINYNGWDGIINSIKENGIRNARILAIAPTGTMSLTFGENCSSGIEPIFMLEVERDIKVGGQDESNKQKFVLRDYAFELAKKQGRLNDSSIFETINDLSVESHIEILHAVAFHVDGSVSKTINLPTEYSFEDTKEVYKEVWKRGIKGCTIFRPNPLRQGIFNSTKETKVDAKTDKPHNDLEWGVTISADDSLIGRKRKIMSGCGSLHVQAYFDPIDGRLMEVYLSKGSDGGCLSFMTGLSRTISASLRTGLDFNYLIDQLKSIPTCPSYAIRTKTKGDTSKGRSCPEAIAYALIEMQGEINEQLGIEEEHSEVYQSIIRGLQDAVEAEKNNNLPLMAKCPECGEMTLAYEGGCDSCKSCGYTHCG